MKHTMLQNMEHNEMIYNLVFFGLFLLAGVVFQVYAKIRSIVTHRVRPKTPLVRARETKKVRRLLSSINLFGIVGLFAALAGASLAKAIAIAAMVILLVLLVTRK